MFLKLSGLIEGQLRDAYDKKFRVGELNQSSLAAKLGVNRSAVHHRLTGRTNMTIETIADMIWGLGQDVDLKIFDPQETKKNSAIVDVQSLQIPTRPVLANAATAPVTTASALKKPPFAPALVGAS